VAALDDVATAVLVRSFTESALSLVPSRSSREGVKSILLKASIYRLNYTLVRFSPPVDRCIEFIEATEIDCFAPAIGTAHGLYKTEPKINFERVEAIVARRPTPIVLHGGTGLSSGTFKRLIAAGCAKVNISTMLKITFAESFKNYLEAKPKEYDPMKLQKAVYAAVLNMAKKFMETFGSAGRA
jgi:fructose-bisphosphate aldolase class II